MSIDSGTPVVITDAAGKKWRTVALGPPRMGDSKKFMVVWVNRPNLNGSTDEFDPCPWPADSVEEASE